MDRARESYMKGLITIEKSAVGTDSFLGEFGMNLSKAARAVAIPSLEIDQPDCRRAAHSSSVGPIDATQLFYLESRGIPPDEARKFIVLGFLEPVVARVPLEPTPRTACASCSRTSGPPASRVAPDGRGLPAQPRDARSTCSGLEEVPEGTMKMAWVDGTDQVVVVHADGRHPRLPGHLHPRVLRARQGLPDRRRSRSGRQPRDADLRAAPVALRPRHAATPSIRPPSCRSRATR